MICHILTIKRTRYKQRLQWWQRRECIRLNPGYAIDVQIPRCVSEFGNMQLNTNIHIHTYKVAAEVGDQIQLTLAIFRPEQSMQFTPHVAQTNALQSINGMVWYGMVLHSINWFQFWFMLFISIIPYHTNSTVECTCVCQHRENTHRSNRTPIAQSPHSCIFACIHRYCSCTGYWADMS